MRLLWSSLACGVLLIVLIAPAFGASPRNGDDDRQCTAAGATPTPLVTPRGDDEDDRDAAEEQDEDCPEATPRPTPHATPRPTPRHTPRATPKPASCDDNEHESDDEGGDD